MLLATFCTNRSRFWRRSLAASAGGRGREGRGERASEASGGARDEDVPDVEGEERRRTLVERVVGVGLEEQVLEADHDGVEVQDGLPVLAQDVEANVALEVEVRVVDLRAGEGKSRSGEATKESVRR